MENKTNQFWVSNFTQNPLVYTFKFKGSEDIEWGITDIFLISFISQIECRKKNSEGLSLPKEYHFKKILGCTSIFLSGKERYLCYVIR